MADSQEYNSEVLSNGLFHSVTKITIHGYNASSTGDLDINITSNPDRWQTILIATGTLFLAGTIVFVFYKLCTISLRSVMTKRGRRRLTPQEEALNEILANHGARQILSSLARTAINSQTNRRNRDFASQNSITSRGTGDVLDISERVVRVSFAPDVRAMESEDEKSLGGESIRSEPPPAYETLANPPSPPLYSELKKNTNSDSTPIPESTPTSATTPTSDPTTTPSTH
ncbi:uncharacterized protein LOC111696461 [Eurytemora carolleeae]|uniref:uncharacterized protein LOC111696461 n=1 Tax=Eurytemora carolleeae TaxID=1294199 RepID=UPI000C775DBE|nr:uncharacterized protein LOC111696461 [Eurytemora carolleeae]XP_023321836.1 uncharacterized protein LOC111696461 [Eurytemora carolleeae]XP_023321837.1 uncharacterized protein LOC111696461 [Eurytemora carolleeae]XP_023321838.1 uncharacterized protein LOC111696461 [Eurytemora carolleeae]XP_023321839.1 uncharacterized protein LOC111696461 [Eurytemora carolleeae]|eukprot:XP_023321834.1 uncharacterized protein LOC111696461 [Eurytemora affinis]